MANKAPPTAVVSPNLGLYLGYPSTSVPARGLEDGLNFRIKRTAITAFGLGWESFIAQTLGGPVTLLDVFLRTDGSSILIAGTLTDLFEFVPGTPDRWQYLTPRYETGTASAAGTAVTGVGTLWNTGQVRVRPGDEISFGATGRRELSDLWYPIASVNSDTSITLAVSAGTVGAGAYTIRQKFQSVTIENFWMTETVPRGDISGVIADRWYATNRGQDFIVRLSQADTQVTRIHTDSVTGFKCRTLRRHKNMLLYLNIIENTGSTPNKPQSFKNSDVGLPENMTGGLAGEFVVAPRQFPIQVALPIGDDLAVYSKGEIVMATFIGSPDIWAFRTAAPDTGLIAPRLIAVFSDYHDFLSTDAAQRFNGIQTTNIDDQVWFATLRQQDQNRIDVGYTSFDDENGQLTWAVPRANDANPSVRENDLIFSEEFNASAIWVTTNATVTANSVADPLTGLTTADTITDNAVNAQHGVHQDVAKAAAPVQYAASVYLDPVSITKARLQLGDTAGTDTAFVDFDLATGAVITSGVTGTYTLTGFGVETVGDFRRVYLIAITDSEATVRFTLRLLNAAGAVSYVGSSQSLRAWGAQLQPSGVLLPYIRSMGTPFEPATEMGPEFAWEGSYLETLPAGTPTPYSKRQYPFTAAGLFVRQGAELLWSDLTEAWSAYNFAWNDRLLAAAFPVTLTGDIYGRVWQLGTTDTQDGVVPIWFVTFGRRLIGDYRSRNIVWKVYPLVRQLPAASYPLIVTTTVYDSEGQETGSSTVQNFPLTAGADSTTFLKPRRRGRLAQMQFGCTGGPAELHGYDWTILPAGSRGG